MNQKNKIKTTSNDIHRESKLFKNNTQRIHKTKLKNIELITQNYSFFVISNIF